MTATPDTTTEIVQRLDRLYEFDRAPVSDDRLESGGHFAALFAGEHVAGTEFVIGALFISWGATTRDILLGLLLGNLLAVLSWTLVCAPIAVDTRLTLYWHLRRIAGPAMTLLYNVLNAILFCVLAGAMITVSASAVRIPFGIPPQTHWYPQDARFVLVVFVVGAVTVGLAVLGFRRLAQFSAVCSPWIFCIFFAGAMATLPGLAADTLGVGSLHSVSDVLRLADERIWTGVAPDRQSTIGFWHVVAFAWICNLAMHIGLSDMALLRYAKNSWYGLYSACGMYLGHYLAWICAGVMGAAAASMLRRPLSELDAGEVAFQSVGAAGAIAVVLAGWTTSNPTLYRAGLALQAITPGWPRWLVTLLAGIATTVIACSPFVFQWLLQFVAIYGLLLMPVGTIVFVEHWLFPRLGWSRGRANRNGRFVNWAAFSAWIAGLGFAVTLFAFNLLHEFFLAAPVWLFTASLYLVLSVASRPRVLHDDIQARAASGIESSEVRNARPPVLASATSAPPVELVVRARNRAVVWLFGGLAVSSFLFCLGLSLWIFQAPSSDYAERLLFFKTALLAASLVHLVSAAAWTAQIDRTPTAPA